MYELLMFLHVGSMFIATALAIGPIAVWVLVLRSSDLGAIRRTFAHSEAISRAGGIAYGLGVVFGVITALNGGIDLFSRWLVLAYVLLGLLVANNLYADHWIRAVEVAAQKDAAAEVARWAHSNRPAASLAGAALLTLALVFVMVVKP